MVVSIFVVEVAGSDMMLGAGEAKIVGSKMVLGAGEAVIAGSDMLEASL